MNFFKIVTEDSQEMFLMKCTKLLNDGYTPLGGVSTTSYDGLMTTYTLGFIKKTI